MNELTIIEYKTEKYYEVVKDIATEIFFNRLIPVFGAGLTVGELTNFNKKVPSANELKTIMINNIISYDKDELEELEFYELASVFFECMIEKQDIAKNIFKELFTNIYLSEDSNRYKFINLNWKTIYTLNIDDAIENNSIFKTILTPDINFNEQSIKDYKSVIKLHGDAKQNIINSNSNLAESIVFSKEIYIKALLENKRILSYFVSELSRLNTLFYGCSFQSLEFDIEGIIASEKETIKENIELKRYFVTSDVPDKKLKLRKLKNDFLITHIIDLKEIKNYDIFLNDVINIYSEIESEDKNKINNFSNFILKVSIINSTERENNMKYLLGLESNKYIDYVNNIYKLPYYTIERNIKKDFLSSLTKNNLTILKGKKVSGKTTFIFKVLSQYENKTAYYIPSIIDISLTVLEEMIVTLSNSVIILDSNSFDYNHLFIIKNNYYKLKDNNSNLILIFNSYDNTTLGSFYSIFNKMDFKEFTLSNILENDELEKINNKLNHIPLPNFKNKITINDLITKHRKHNFLDNIIRIDKTIYKDEEYIKWEDYQITKIKEFTLLFILSTLDKFNLSSYYLVYGGINELKKLVNKFSPFIDEVYISQFESEQASGAKIISNSQVSLTYLLTEAIKNNTLSIDDITDELSKVISKLYKNKIHKYQELLFFDNLKENLHTSHKETFQKIVIELYKKLEKELTDDKHYWLQRAKSILYMQSSDINAVKDGLRFSTKIYTDEIIKESKLSGYAAHITAMLYGRLISLEDYKNLNNIQEAIEFYHLIFEQYDWNKMYIKNMIKREDKNDLKILCFDFNDRELDMEYKIKLKELRSFYRDYSHN